MFFGLLVISSVSAFANDLGAKLKSCDFAFARIDYSYVDLSDVPMEENHYVYTSKTKQVIFEIELPFKEMPALVKMKQNKVVITYPSMNDNGDIEVNQSITISTKKVVESNSSEVIFKATMKTFGLKDHGTCRFSL